MLERTAKKLRTRLGTLLLLAVLVTQVATGHKPHPVFPPDGVALGGMLLLLAAVTLRVWARGHFTRDGRLYTSGPYARIRHPLYVGSFLAACGIALILGHWLAWVGVLAYFGLLFSSAVVREERRLRERFGPEWDAYAAKVPRFLPRPGRRLPFPRERWQWQAFRNTQETLTAAALLATPVLLGLLGWWAGSSN
jgi:protein-S-isoprenylcysteine O-methyltransferase Ste14